MASSTWCSPLLPVLGCVGRDTTEVLLKGPLPSFTIEDTMGCAPFHVQFHNTTGKQLKNWTWYFGDPSNQTFTTLTDSDVDFTYDLPGVYSIKLLAVEDIFNPSTGNTIICPASFPDSITQLPSRKVYVLPIWPVSIIAEDTVCINEPLEFTALANPGYSGFHWTFGDGGGADHNRPDTTAAHTFTKTGIHEVWLVPLVSTGYECIDSVSTTVFVSSVEAEFEIDSTQKPQFAFPNKSLQGVRYLWDYGQPEKGAANQSALFDGSFNFGEDTGTFIICLTTFNAEDCSDSVCKSITLARLDEHLIIPNVFTPDNNDGIRMMHTTLIL
jgi:PKD repeat protein